MSQSVTVIPVPDESSVTLVRYSMQHMLMKFGPCSLVVLDYGSQYKGTLIAMC